MRRALLALALCCALSLTGCSALLERPYAVVESHTEQPAAGDGSSDQAGTYSELVNAVLFFVSQGTEVGELQLVDYTGDVEEDLNRACLEVATEDPLGAYAVDFIKNQYTRVLTTYEATITISYRRTREQINSLVNVTGTSAIRNEVAEALADYRSEVVLRVGYSTADADAIATGTPEAIEGREDIASFFNGAAHAALPVSVDGRPGSAWYHRGQARVLFDFMVTGGCVARIDFRAAPEVIAQVVRRDGAAPR